MKFIRDFLPHLAISMLLSLVVLVILDDRNPLMAFLTSRVSKIYILLLCLVCLAALILSIADSRRDSRH